MLLWQSQNRITYTTYAPVISTHVTFHDRTIQHISGAVEVSPSQPSQPLLNVRLGVPSGYGTVFVTGSGRPLKGIQYFTLGSPERAYIHETVTIIRQGWPRGRDSW